MNQLAEAQAALPEAILFVLPFRQALRVKSLSVSLSDETRAELVSYVRDISPGMARCLARIHVLDMGDD